MTKPKIQVRMVFHANGGSKFSRLNYRIVVDGVDTDIMLLEETDGSPHYRYTARVLRCGDEELDLLEPHPSPVDWILERVPKGVKQ